MTWLPQIKWRILVALRELGGLQGVFEIGDHIDEAPFRVRAELLELRRMRLVFRDKHYSWGLTRKGTELTWANQQEELPA